VAAKLPLNRLTVERDVHEKTSSRGNVSQQVEQFEFCVLRYFYEYTRPAGFMCMYPKWRAACIMRAFDFVGKTSNDWLLCESSIMFLRVLSRPHV